ncbi:auxin response factor 18 isoform X2 [Physcomitrium patens]|nr:auxin response factor 10-like isoform X2 [Physcomitrium patens]XP_024373024.1 auxin response factor 10-like isoform X2 [Physcomitrium patens]PNR55244.1 hypothetical protein PHYPA_006139 [Physcomitrium patens]|eukprot:XP_024373023.1 auxin response factor 10-like isoform X2 [Physcomitrella patens]
MLEPGLRLSMGIKTEKLGDSGGRERSMASGVGESVDRLDAQLWHACAGGMVQLPQVGAKVIYFPQGHGEQAATTPDFSASMGPSGTIPCRVVSVNFLADTETDEVFARMRLQPEGLHGLNDMTEEAPSSPPPEKPASFAKTLTQSDANNGGGFSVPRYCAETIFPPLDYSSDPPVQTVLAKDVHGDVWKFRHIYRGTPRRHLLTTGWSTFVNQKKLVAGDAIVFLRSASGELCVGVRRSMRGASGGDSSTWHSSANATRASRWEVKGTESFSDFFAAVGDNGHGGSSNGVSRSGSQGASTTSSFARNRARVTAKSVLDAAALAVAGKPFEVVYYPRASTAEFCVKAGLVKQALDHTWYAGMRFKMAFETEDSSRISWFMGTIAAVKPADPLLWPNSPWRVLQVTWDEPDLLQGVSRVSPWQVELVATLPMQLPPFSYPKKKLRAVQPQELQLQAPGLLNLPLAGSSSFAGQLPTPWGGPALLENASAGMQGARHDRFNGPPSMDFRYSNYKRAREHPSENQYAEQGQTSPAGSARVVLSDPLCGDSHHQFSFLSSGQAHNGGQQQQQQQQSSQMSGSGLTMGLMPGGSPTRDDGGSNSKSKLKSSPAPTTFLLFGQSIDPSSNSKAAQEQCVASASSSVEGSSLFQEGLRVSPTSYSSSDNTLEHKDRMRRFNADLNGASGGTGDGAMSRYRQNEGGPWPELSIGTEVGSLKWFKEQRLEKEKGSNEALQHCKVFREGDEVGRTLDLANFKSYEEVYDRLAGMFSVPAASFKNRVVYQDGEGCTLPVGAEPYG